MVGKEYLSRAESPHPCTHPATHAHTRSRDHTPMSKLESPRRPRIVRRRELPRLSPSPYSPGRSAGPYGAAARQPSDVTGEISPPRCGEPPRAP